MCVYTYTCIYIYIIAGLLLHVHAADVAAALYAPDEAPVVPPDVYIYIYIYIHLYIYIYIHMYYV